jgi:Na+:H+ antiporter, NhaA family
VPDTARTRPHPALRRARRRAQRGAQLAATEVIRFLRTEQIGGVILLAATALALIVANSPLGDAYQRLSDARIGPAALHLNLTVATWAKDGLLAFFFAVAGLELKRELVAGELRRPRRALLPILRARRNGRTRVGLPRRGRRATGGCPGVGGAGGD